MYLFKIWWEASFVTFFKRRSCIYVKYTYWIINSYNNESVQFLVQFAIYFDSHVSIQNLMGNFFCNFFQEMELDKWIFIVQFAIYFDSHVSIQNLLGSFFCNFFQEKELDKWIFIGNLCIISNEYSVKFSVEKLSFLHRGGILQVLLSFFFGFNINLNLWFV